MSRSDELWKVLAYVGLKNGLVERRLDVVLFVLSDALADVGDGKGQRRCCRGSEDVAKRRGLPHLGDEAELVDAGSKKLGSLILVTGGLRSDFCGGGRRERPGFCMAQHVIEKSLSLDSPLEAGTPDELALVRHVA